MEPYNVKLEIFEGPLDLLLHLIKKKKMDIYDIKISEITKGYLEYLDLMRTLDINIASEFLVMAATLMNLKSRMLLPRTSKQDDQEEETIESLVQQLIEYQKFKEVAKELEEMERRESLHYPRVQISYDENEQKEPELRVSVFDLLIAIKDLVEKNIETIQTEEIELNEIKIEDKTEYITNQLRENGKTLFRDLFIKQEAKYGIIVTFIALLELLRLRKIHAFQNRSFGPIWIDLKESSDKNPQILNN